MDSHHALVFFVLLPCVLCKGSSTETNAGLDEASQLRHKWLLSLKEPKPIDKDVLNAIFSRRLSSYQLLYCRVGIGYHLQIFNNGSVRGVHEPTEYSWMRVFAMKAGVVGIRGMKSKLYLCMNKEGIARGMKDFSPNCLFKEHLEENHYTTYSSTAYPSMYLALSQRGQLRRGNAVGSQHASTHFLPRNTI